ncbi:MAG: MFS transporter [Bryobacterales bacterium]|nr:MFS transporter [Bryobacterales bacterium]
MGRLAGQFPALRHGRFRVYLTGHFTSQLGSWMQTVAQSWMMYRLTNSELLLGLTFFCTHIPMLVLNPVGGWVIDHVPRRRLLVACQILNLLQALVLLGLTVSGRITAMQVLWLALALGVVQAFENPGRQALIVEVVGKADLISAIGLHSAAFNTARIVGPSLAGLVVAAYGEAVCFGLNAVSFLAMLVGLAVIRPVPGHASGRDGGVLDGYRYVWREPHLRLVFGLSGVMNLCYAPILALGPFFADGIFQKGSAGLGFLTGSMGCGALLGVLLLARQKSVATLPGLMAQSTILMGVGLMTYAWSPSYWLSLVTMFVIGYSIVRQNAGGNSLVQMVVHEKVRGRVMAIYVTALSGFLPFGTLGAGALARLVGPRPVVCLAAVICLAAAISYQRVLPRFQDWVKQQEEPCAV